MISRTPKEDESECVGSRPDLQGCVRFQEPLGGIASAGHLKNFGGIGDLVDGDKADAKCAGGVGFFTLVAPRDFLHAFKVNFAKHAVVLDVKRVVTDVKGDARSSGVAIVVFDIVCILDQFIGAWEYLVSRSVARVTNLED